MAVNCSGMWNYRGKCCELRVAGRHSVGFAENDLLAVCVWVVQVANFE